MLSETLTTTGYPLKAGNMFRTEQNKDSNSASRSVSEDYVSANGASEEGTFNRGMFSKYLAEGLGFRTHRVL